MNEEQPMCSGVPRVYQDMVSFGEATVRFLTRWTFRGRASRSEYWWAVLANTLFALGAEFVFPMLILFVAAFGIPALVYLGLALYWIFQWVLVIPFICISVRRLHDTNHSGWCFLLNFLPIIGQIILLVFYCSASDAKTNTYGPMPNLVPLA